MGFKDKAVAFGKKFKLDSHHAIERFGVFFGVFSLLGIVVIGGSGAAAIRADNETLAHTALYTTSFETSKTALKGDVDGIYSNENGDKVLVMMHFASNAAISYNAADYEAFLLGSDTNLNSETVKTGGIEGTFHVFGSTGYVGVLLDADKPFSRQVLNLTVRANAELTFDERETSKGTSIDAAAADASFTKYDQWRVFFNPGASGVEAISALDAANFDPAQAYYDIVLKESEQETRDKLDRKLIEMRTALSQIEVYSSDLQTTKVDGLFLRPPTVPTSIANDTIEGQTAGESEDGVSTLTLNSEYTVPGGFDFNWRDGDVYTGYLDNLVPSGQSYVQYLADKNNEESDPTATQISNMSWILSDGSDLKKDYQSSDVTMRPLTNVMNNLSQAYQTYVQAKTQYQSDLLLELIRLDIQLRDVQSNGSINSDSEFLRTFY